MTDVSHFADAGVGADSRLYRGILRGHRMHHDKNEHYWFGITSHLGDRVLRTYHDRQAVETSPTCRTLGVAIG